MPEFPDRTHALVLAGGAAYAAYEVGVVKALVNGMSQSTDRQPLVPRVVAGSSGGAFNAALLVSAAARGAAAAVDHLERTWLDDVADTAESCGNGVFRFRLDPLSLVDPACLRTAPLPFTRFVQDSISLSADLFRRGTRLFTSDSSLEQRFMELVDLETFVSIDPFRRVILGAITPASIRSSDWALQIATINWKTGALRMFENADFVNDDSVGIIQAATAVPGLFPSVDLDGEPYADASFVLDAPLKPAIDAGADVLHVVYFNPDVERLPLPRVRNTVSTLNRSVLITLAAMINRDIEIASRINLALVALRRASGPVSARESSAINLETGSRESHEERGEEPAPHRFVEIHRYHAREPFGQTFKWLSFGRDHLEALIAQGVDDTQQHDCTANRCILNN